MTDGMNWTPRETWLAYYSVRDLLARRALARQSSVPDGMDAFHNRLVGFLRETKTCALQENSAPSSEDELIDTAKAAAVLKCSPQWVRRIRDELGGRDIGGRYVFQRQAVVEYAVRKAGQNK
jgi:hypothetical protein